jgi:hypothetical protein
VVLLPRPQGLTVTTSRRGVYLIIASVTQGAGYGAALRILLSMHAFRVYSSDTTYSSHSDAKAACAKTAVDEGVIDYLKRGNGHSPPSEPVHDSHVRISGMPVTAGPISLQAFYESLPRPFPELVGEKTALEINGPAWLNTTIQAAKGGRFKATFFWMTDASAGRKLLQYIPSMT